MARGGVGPGADHVLVTELDGNISLYDPRRAEVHVLNVTASQIWRLLDGSRSIEDVVEVLADAYSLDPVEVQAAVAATVSTFVERGLLDGSTPARGAC